MAFTEAKDTKSDSQPEKEKAEESEEDPPLTQVLAKIIEASQQGAEAAEAVMQQRAEDSMFMPADHHGTEEEHKETSAEDESKAEPATAEYIRIREELVMPKT